MGGLLSYLFRLPSSVCNFANKGFTYVSSYIISYIYFTVVRWFKKSRFDIYEYEASNEPEKNSFFIPDIEWQLDSPQKIFINQSPKQADDVFCFGVNSKSEVLNIHIARHSNGKVHCSLLLRLSDGRILSLPKEHVIQQETGEDYTFGSSRLKFQCIIPMRKWRVFFNGILEEHSGDSNMPTYQHVRMTFLWTASSRVFDFSSDMGKSLLAHNLSQSSDWNLRPKDFLQWVKNTFMSYEQPGMLLGSLKIADEEEKEMYLWGARGHYTGETRNTKELSIFQIYGSFKYGEVVHLAMLNIAGQHFLYGYLMRSDGFIYPFENLVDEETEVKGMKFKFFSGNMDHQLTIEDYTCRDTPFGNEYEGKSSVNYANMILDEMPGRGIIMKGTGGDNTHSIIPKQDLESNRNHLLTIPFASPECQDSGLTGGKGSSLGKLHSISKDYTAKTVVPPFVVPNGFVVTMEAYKEFTNGDLGKRLNKFEKSVWSASDQNIKELCHSVIHDIQGTILPINVIKSIKTQLAILMPGEQKKFAVRSSAVGEDTEQMSAAGQMETFLGLKAVDEILAALKMCWASQFTFQAVEYKRRYGQLLNSPMAVVVQEMVPCEVAGVTFTCDPVTGNPSYINITANWGLGESVVSAAAEPDTVVLDRSMDNAVSFHSQQIGKKQSKVVMKGDSGTEEVSIQDDQATSCCLTLDMSLKLGQLAVMIEEQFGSARDLEWGIIRDEIFLFQSRPVTSLDVNTDFEIKHFYDSFLRNEEDYLTTGNVGEVMPGAMSILGMDFFSKLMDFSVSRSFYNKEELNTIPDFPYYSKKIIYFQNHSFFTMVDSLNRFKQGNSDLAKGMSIAILGRIFSDKNLDKMAEQRHNVYGKNYAPNPFYTTIKLMLIFFLLSIKNLFSKGLEKFQLIIPDNKTPAQMLREIGRNIPVYAESLKVHVGYTISSSIWNMFLLSTLAKAEGDWNSNVYSDFAYLLSTCTDVESADVPQAIQKLARCITKCIDPKKFAEMNHEEATAWLKSSQTEAGAQFLQFQSKHGHRCLKEFDTFSETWGTNPQPLLKILQNLVLTDLTVAAEKEETPSFQTLMSKLQVKLSFSQKLSLRWIVPSSRRGVRGREASKSACIKVLHQFRLAFRQLANKMVHEGYVPHKDLVSFLCIAELSQLIKTRSPRIITRAIKRRKMLEELDKLIFPEISSGIPMPVKNEKEIDASTKGFCMTGVPVSQGVAKATARVVTNLSDADAIQPGDILIAHSTDIGWSPYFPLLSGVVTELGGLISHGAVVAREYGLPCVVGLHGATRAFNSGDLVLLDGNKGTLQRIDSECE